MLIEIVWSSLPSTLFSKVCRGFKGITKLGSLVGVSETLQISAEVELFCGEVAGTCSEPLLAFAISPDVAWPRVFLQLF